MPDFINAETTQDGYVAALELAPAPYTKQITFSVIAASGSTAANAVLATFAKYPALANGQPDYGQQPQWESFERLFVGNTIGAIPNEWAGGVKFRSATTGAPATITAERDFQTDIIVAAGNVTSASVSASGQTNIQPVKGGTQAITWPGGAAESNVATVAHGLGATPSAVVGTVDLDGVSNTGTLDLVVVVMSVGATTFDVAVVAGDGSVPTSAGRASVRWIAVP